MKTTRTPATNDDLKFEAEVNSFVSEVHEAIQEARSKMSGEDVARADKEAASILKAASDAAKSSRRSA